MSSDDAGLNVIYPRKFLEQPIKLGYDCLLELLLQDQQRMFVIYVQHA